VTPHILDSTDKCKYSCRFVKVKYLTKLLCLYYLAAPVFVYVVCPKFDTIIVIRTTGTNSTAKLRKYPVTDLCPWARIMPLSMFMSCLRKKIHYVREVGGDAKHRWNRSCLRHISQMTEKLTLSHRCRNACLKRAVRCSCLLVLWNFRLQLYKVNSVFKDKIMKPWWM
jgi:hypothetical protein